MYMCVCVSALCVCSSPDQVSAVCAPWFQPGLTSGQYDTRIKKIIAEEKKIHETAYGQDEEGAQKAVDQRASTECKHKQKRQHTRHETQHSTTQYTPDRKGKVYKTT